MNGRTARATDGSPLAALAAIVLALVLAACGGSGGSGDPDAGGGSPPADSDAVVDPAPELNEPGAYGCDGCPNSLLDDFNVSTSESTRRFDGIVDGAVGNGEFFVRSVAGQAISGVIATDASGAFEFTAPLFCGVQTAKFVWSNDIGRYVLVTEITREDCVDADIRLTLTWDDRGRDFELHLLEPGGTLNDDESDCTWTSCVSSSPDWGIEGDPSDDPRKDADNTFLFGPENIRLDGAVPGTYRVYVEHWGNGDPEAAGSVTFNVDGRTRVAKISGLAPRFVWSVGTIEWPSGDVVLDGSTVDCNADWSGGCRLPLPDRSPPSP